MHLVCKLVRIRIFNRSALFGRLIVVAGAKNSVAKEDKGGGWTWCSDSIRENAIAADETDFDITNVRALTLGDVCPA